MCFLCSWGWSKLCRSALHRVMLPVTLQCCAPEKSCWRAPGYPPPCSSHPSRMMWWSHGLLEVPCSSQQVPGASFWPHPDAKKSLQSAVGLRAVANCCRWSLCCWQWSVGRASALQWHLDVTAREGLPDSHSTGIAEQTHLFSVTSVFQITGIILPFRSKLASVQHMNLVLQCSYSWNHTGHTEFTRLERPFETIKSNLSPSKWIQGKWIWCQINLGPTPTHMNFLLRES